MPKKIRHDMTTRCDGVKASLSPPRASGSTCSSELLNMSLQGVQSRRLLRGVVRGEPEGDSVRTRASGPHSERTCSTAH